jgi:hypothetical protein
MPEKDGASAERGEDIFPHLPGGLRLMRRGDGGELQPEKSGRRPYALLRVQPENAQV